MGERGSAGDEPRFEGQGYRPETSAENGGWGSEEEHLMKYGKLGALGAGALLVLSACSSTATTAPGASTGAGSSTGAAVSPGAWCVGGTVKIGTELPMSGGETANGVPTANGVKLLIAQINAAGGVLGCKLDINVQDDALNGVHDPQTGAKNMQTLVADASR